MLASLGRLELLAEELELLLRDLDLGHAETDPQLGGSDEARSELVEVTERFIDSNPLLRADCPDSGKDVVDVERAVTHDLGVGGSCSSLGEVIIRVVKVSADTEILGRAVNILTEINIVDFVDIASVHVSAEDHLQNVCWSSDPKKVNNSEELILSNMTVLGYIKVLETGLEVDSSSVNCITVGVQDFFNLLCSLVAAEVLSSGKQSIVLV